MADESKRTPIASSSTATVVVDDNNKAAPPPDSESDLVDVVIEDRRRVIKSVPENKPAVPGSKRPYVRRSHVDVEIPPGATPLEGGSGYVIDAEEFYAHLAQVRARKDMRKQDNIVEQREDKVRERLMRRGDCDLSTLSCHISNCTRAFESVRVLAWHMSYSHTDSESPKEEHTMCLVCGRQMASVKGKNSHLATGHRDLCVLHNTQCVQQRVPPKPVMARKRRKIVPRYGGTGPNPEESIQHYLLKDEIVYDEDSDYEEDVSVSEEATSESRLPTPGIVARAGSDKETIRAGVSARLLGNRAGLTSKISSSLRGNSMAHPKRSPNTDIELKSANSTAHSSTSENPKIIVQDVDPDPVIVVDDDGEILKSGSEEDTN